jgi:NCS1 family nucleobase:cation symporter-1
LILGPLAGIYVADYYIFRKKKVELADLFLGENGRYWYSNGVNYRAVFVWFLSALVVLMGKFFPGVLLFARISENGILVGFILAAVVYPLVMRNERSSLEEKAGQTADAAV